MKLPEQFREPVRMALLLAIATALALAPDAYLPMLARAFLVQWTLLFLLITLVTGWRKQWWTAMGALCGALVLLVQVRTHSMAITHGTGPGIRVLHMNVLQPNMHFQQVIQLAVRSGADVISVQEVGPDWADALEAGLSPEYPFRYVETRSNCYGIAMFSKRPFQRISTVTMMGAPFIEAVLEVEGRPVRLLAVHTTSPISYAHFRRRNEQFDQLASHLNRSDTATVLIGDLNTVPWDRAFQRFCASTGMRPVSNGIQRTWPAVGPFALIPLDHLLVSGEVVPSALETFPIPGSDHRGLLAEIRSGHAR